MLYKYGITANCLYKVKNATVMVQRFLHLAIRHYVFCLIQNSSDRVNHLYSGTNYR